MHSIYCYLLKDIADIVLDYVYRPDIKKLNKEYSSKIESRKFTYIEYYIFRYLLLNYRFYKNDYKIYNILEIDTGVYLPNNYFYSSGCNDLNRFKNK